MKEAQPLSNPLKCISLLVDGNKTHSTLEGLQKIKSCSVDVVVFPPHLTDVILKRYPEPMAHGPEACEPSHPLWPMAQRPASCHTRAEAVDTGYLCSLTREI